jgi:CheY-like chemotaxis protein
MAKVLIIDDDPDIVEAVRLILESSGHTVEEARDGASGLRKVKEFGPDLIILDVMMESDSAGFHVAYQLRSQDPESEYAAYSKVPILMLTAIGKQRGMAFSPETDQEFLPVDEFVEKPIQPADLLEKVARLTGG